MVWTSNQDDKGALLPILISLKKCVAIATKALNLSHLWKSWVSRNNLVIDLGTLTDEYEKEISIHTTATSKDGEKDNPCWKEVTTLIPSN